MQIGTQIIKTVTQWKNQTLEMPGNWSNGLDDPPLLRRFALCGAGSSHSCLWPSSIRRSIGVNIIVYGMWIIIVYDSFNCLTLLCSGSGAVVTTGIAGFLPSLSGVNYQLRDYLWNILNTDIFNWLFSRLQLHFPVLSLAIITVILPILYINTD